MMQIGVELPPQPSRIRPRSHAQSCRAHEHLLEEIELADQVGLEVFGIGEHHRAEFLDSAPAVILARGCVVQQEHSPYQRRHCSQRSRPRTRLPGIRHTRPDLSRPR